MAMKTSIDVSEAVRKKVVPVLQARLVDAIDLGLQTKQAHWNVKGPSFIGLHELFDKVAEDIEGHVDEIAERIVQLGGAPVGTARVVAKTSELPEYPLEIRGGMDHCKALSKALAAFGKSVRADIDATSKAGDADSADLLTGVSRNIDKNLWFVEAHLHAEN